MIVFPAKVPMEHVLEHSFRDYHTRGFDYVCLKRSPTETIKLYFFDGDVSKLPEVICPHDHRYDFAMMVVTGASQNVWYSEASPRMAALDQGTVFERFAYETPLLGGDGFTHVGQTRLVEKERVTYRANEKYSMGYNEIHTIRMIENETVLCLLQKEDVVTDRPTLTFTRGTEPPSLAGMYKPFTADGVLNHLKRLKERAPWVSLPEIV